MRGKTPARRRDPRTACIEGASLDDDRRHVDRAALIGSDPRLPDSRFTRQDLRADGDRHARRRRQIDRKQEQIRRGTRSRRQIVVAQVEVQMIAAAGAVLSRQLGGVAVVVIVAAPAIARLLDGRMDVVAGVMHRRLGEGLPAATMPMRDERAPRRSVEMAVVMVTMRRRHVAAGLERNAELLASPKRREPLHEEEHDGDVAGEGVGHGEGTRAWPRARTCGPRKDRKGIDDRASGIQPPPVGGRAVVPPRQRPVGRGAASRGLGSFQLARLVPTPRITAREAPPAPPRRGRRLRRPTPSNGSDRGAVHRTEGASRVRHDRRSGLPSRLPRRTPGSTSRPPGRMRAVPKATIASGVGSQVSQSRDAAFTQKASQAVEQQAGSIAQTASRRTRLRSRALDARGSSCPRSDRRTGRTPSPRRRGWRVRRWFRRGLPRAGRSLELASCGLRTGREREWRHTQSTSRGGSIVLQAWRSFEQFPRGIIPQNASATTAAARADRRESRIAAGIARSFRRTPRRAVGPIGRHIARWRRTPQDGPRHTVGARFARRAVNWTGWTGLTRWTRTAKRCMCCGGLA